MSLGGNPSHVLPHTIAERIRGMHGTPQGADNWKLAFGFSWTSPYSLFPFADFSQCPLDIINNNSECND